MLNTKNLAIDNLSTPTAYTTIQSRTTKHNYTQGEKLRLDEGNNDKTHHPFHPISSHSTLHSTLLSIPFTPHHPHPQLDTIRSCTIKPMCIHTKYTADVTTRQEKQKQTDRTWILRTLWERAVLWNEICFPPSPKKDQRDRIEGNRTEHKRIKDSVVGEEKGSLDSVNVMIQHTTTSKQETPAKPSLFT